MKDDDDDDEEMEMNSRPIGDYSDDSTSSGDEVIFSYYFFSYI